MPRVTKPSRAPRFPAAHAREIDGTKYLYVRAGSDHRFIAIWVVLAGGRVVVRSWNDKPRGWYRAFLKHRRGTIRVGDRDVPVRARHVTSARLLDAADAAYAAKYTTKANQPYVRGFATATRRATTLELTPAMPLRRPRV